MGTNARKPDFKTINQIIEGLLKTDMAFQRMFEEVDSLEEAAREACGTVLLEQATGALSDFSLEELKNSNTPIRTELLAEAGFRTLGELYKAQDRVLLDIPGIGEKQLAAIRLLTDEFRHTIAGREGLRLSSDLTDSAERELITRTARFRKADPARQEGMAFREEAHSRILSLTEAVTIRGGVRWLFSGRSAKEKTLQAVGDLLVFADGPLYQRMKQLLEVVQEACDMDPEEALTDFRKNSAPYYAWFEAAGGAGRSDSRLYDSVPLQLAAAIRRVELDLSGFKGNLRAYQEFGTRYTIHQGRVLLGDEMGLGKTIQAIAVMTHLEAGVPGCHFLVICPASVLINWCREIRQFSSLETFLLHGPSREANFDRWKAQGGAAVINYEGMLKLVDSIDNTMRLSLLVVDEAHYIKNPKAKRTQAIHRLTEEAERILLMTGTPLENSVEEMCELIQFVRPDMAEGIRKKAQLRTLPEFREILAPVYLRRRREQVLGELPPVIEEQEWCVLTEEDRIAYLQQIQQGSFTGMRRISFLQDDLKNSGKAVRLLELCEEAQREGRRTVVFSFFRETIRKVQTMLGDRCIGAVTGSTSIQERQDVIDRFADSTDSPVLLCQTQAGGTGLNLQMASVVIICEPQLKPSLTVQAIARVHRMGQTENTLVFHLLCEGTVDEAVTDLLTRKQEEFDRFADTSALADAVDDLPDPTWIRRVVEDQRQRYLPATTG